ncbi:hypothetical protein [uncultured Erythrobacter sp.]|uniref:hypothetical protein n=1 Tax=uncultured Erythrobacter sp. TaxID=263913 RepID=UPI00262F9061|nr:hypothetical protein [uncultured Erythrobacter sp.]
MSKLSLLGFVLGVAIIFYGIYALAIGGNSSAFIFIAGGFVITSLAAGIFSKTHSKGSNDAG